MKKDEDDEPVTARLPVSLIHWIDRMRVTAFEGGGKMPSRSEVIRRLLEEARERQTKGKKR